MQGAKHEIKNDFGNRRRLKEIITIVVNFRMEDERVDKNCICGWAPYNQCLSHNHRNRSLYIIHSDYFYPMNEGYS